MADIDVMLRTPQVTYLNSVARREDVSVSKALGAIIDLCVTRSGATLSAKMHRAHVSLKSHHLATLDRMAIETGLSRSEVARRLIDEAARIG